MNNYTPKYKQAHVEFENTFGDDVEIVLPCNIYRCVIGNHVRIGPFVEIQRGCKIGNNVKVGSHTFICAETEIGNDVFIGHGVMTCNDSYPRSSFSGTLKRKEHWKCDPIHICDGASIGTGATILPGVIIGKRAMVGAGAVVTKNVPTNGVVAGNPARELKGKFQVKE